MATAAQRFYTRVRKYIGKDSDLPNFFAYHLTIELGGNAATVTAVRRCYEECDLHAPSWLPSHFSAGLKSKPRRFVKRNSGYRLEGRLREKIAALIENERVTSEALTDT